MIRTLAAREEPASLPRFHDARFQATAVKVGPGDHHVTDREDEMIVTVLGSCIAACVRDPVIRIGGMNHFMLPASATGTWDTGLESMRYGNVAMERLINDLLRRGGRRERLEVKVFGGARMLGSAGSIGPRNADFVESYLTAEGLQIVSRHLRGDHARRINYFPCTGRVMMLELRRSDADVARAEASYRASLRAEPASGTVELFD